MSYKMNSSNCSFIDDSSENSVVAKLRRLKIEENLLINNINKIHPKETYDDDIELPVIYGLELKKYTAKVKNSFIEIKNMFGDIKAATKENLSNLDIENMKRDVIKLDDKIRIFKKQLQSELISTISQEEELTKQMNDVEEKESKCTYRPKTKIKPFNYIAPSPVKVMIQSPFKCPEVQQFQEFMKSSANRHGGWNEYHHNVFVQIWHKHFKSVKQIEYNNESEFTVGNHSQFEAFLKEILQKISGSTYDDMVLHHNWYCKYSYLKERQQNALNKWKKNKMRLSGFQHKGNALDKPKPFQSNGAKLPMTMQNVEELMDTIETRDAEEIANALCDMKLQEVGLSFDTEINMNIGDERASRDVFKQKQRSFSDILKPTKQWMNRCNSSRESVKGYNDLERIKKLRVPEWRLPLQD